MGSQLLIWVVVSLGFFFCFFSLPVVCDEDDVNRETPPPPQELQSSSSPSPSPSSPPTPSPPLPTPPPLLPPPPDQRLPPHSRRLPPPRKPPPPSPWAPRPPRTPPPPPPPPEYKNAFHNPPSNPQPSIEDGNSNVEAKGDDTSKSSKRKPNLGRKVGLTFVGIAAMLQVCVVAFLLIKRRQMLTTTNGSF